MTEKTNQKLNKKKPLTEEEIEEKTAERVSGEPESNLSAVGTGGIAGAATGAAIGAVVGGPVGGAIGAAAGAIAGAAAAEQVVDIIDPKIEEEYWKTQFRKRPYYKPGKHYEYYLPNYRYGWESAGREEFRNRDFEEIESDLRHTWRKFNEDSELEWEEVRESVRDAYERIRTRYKG
jgi:hypothetical protein